MSIDSLVFDELLLSEVLLSVVVPPHPLSTRASAPNANANITNGFFL